MEQKEHTSTTPVKYENEILRYQCNHNVSIIKRTNTTAWNANRVMSQHVCKPLCQNMQNLFCWSKSSLDCLRSIIILSFFNTNSENYVRILEVLVKIIFDFRVFLLFIWYGLPEDDATKFS